MNQSLKPLILLLSVITFSVFFSCQKNFSSKLPGEFNVNEAREWFYGIFKKNQNLKQNRSRA